jgi:uncharacterized protein YaiI (UPF0178 family)
MTILVDADACPVKEQVYAAAYRHKTPVRLYAASYLRHPDHPLISMVMAGDGFDAADDRIVEDAGPGTLVITADLPLAGRAIEKGAAVLTPRGDVLDAANIGGKLATRDLSTTCAAGWRARPSAARAPFPRPTAAPSPRPSKPR